MGFPSFERFEDFGISSSFDFLENITETNFKKLVRSKAKTYSFYSLMSRKHSYKKLRNVTYEEYKMQDYLSDPNTTKEEKIQTFKWRTFMADVGQNFRGGNDDIPCKLCGSHLDSQQEIFSKCTFIKEKIEITERYDDVFNSFIPAKLCKTITNIMKIRNNKN